MRFVQSDLFKNNNRESVVIPPVLGNIPDSSRLASSDIPVPLLQVHGAGHNTVHQTNPARQHYGNPTSNLSHGSDETDSVCIKSPDAVSFSRNPFLHTVVSPPTTTAVRAEASNGNESDESPRNPSASLSEEDRRNLNLQQVLL